MVLFEAGKYKLQHFAATSNSSNPSLTLSDGLVVRPSEYARGNTDREQPATRWLGIWLDRGLTFRRHVEGRYSLGTGQGRLPPTPPRQHRMQASARRGPQSGHHGSTAHCTVWGRGLVRRAAHGRGRTRESQGPHGLTHQHCPKRTPPRGQRGAGHAPKRAGCEDTLHAADANADSGPITAGTPPRGS